MLQRPLIKQEIRGGWILGVLLTIMSACNPSLGRSEIEIVITQSPTSISDRLAEPALPANPTQYEQGRHLYWLNCMPCHGDKGQGLTDEFRSLWVDDHQYCWARGCHSGRPGEEGFPIPLTVPAIISSTSAPSRYATEEDLFEYLSTTHPPQRPGYFSDDEYWAITAYVLTENNRLPRGQKIGLQEEKIALEEIRLVAAIGLIFLIVSAIIAWFHKRHNMLMLPKTPEC